jgi:hypothetical protein
MPSGFKSLIQGPFPGLFECALSRSIRYSFAKPDTEV